MQLGSMFITNCNNTLHVSDAFCVHPQEHLKTVVTAKVDGFRGSHRPWTPLLDTSPRLMSYTRGCYYSF